MDKKERLEAIISHFADNRKSQLAKILDVSPQAINTWLSRNTFDMELIYAKCEGINPEWLFTGQGSMIKEKKENVNLIHKPICSEKRESDRPIPLYNINAAANLRTLFVPDANELLGEIQIPDAPVCDGAIFVSGDSMYPLLKAGDIVAFKKIDGIEGIRFGEMYLIQYALAGDDALVIKYLQKGDDCKSVKLVSYNTYHEPQDIPLSCIRALALVKFSIRKNTII